MKIAGKTLELAKAEIVIIPRIGEDGEPCDIVFKCAPVNNYDEFNQLCPRPEPPKRTYPENTGKPPEILINDPKFLKALDEWGSRRSAWMFVESLSATEDLEWELVDRAKPETWVKWEEELGEAGINDIERSRILTGIMDANSLSEERMDEARERFFTVDQKEQ